MTDQDNQSSGMIGGLTALCLLGLMAVGYMGYRQMRLSQAIAEERLAILAEIEAQKAQQLKAETQRDTVLQANAADQASASLEIDSAAQAEIESKLTKQAADWNNGDFESFMGVYWNSEKLTFSSGGKVTRGWQATLDGYKSRYSTGERWKLAFGDLEFQQLDRSVVLVLGTWHLERNDQSMGGNYSLVWKKIDGQWLIVHDHTSELKK